MENAEIDRLVMKPTARRRLGKYVLLGRVGHGGMGKIYLGYAPGPAGIEKLLVVKRLHGHLTSDPVLVNSFLDEARLSMALNHQNIVHTYDVGDVDGRYFMVMEYIEGQNLGVLLRTAKRSGAYPSSALWASIFLGVLDGLHAAHVARDARGRPLHIIHRDVSPQNVLVTYEGLPKLVDFGIAKAAMRVSETDAGVLKGKYAYMSPEQVRGEVLDARSDVFAAGIVLWEMLAGRRLYKAETIVRSVERILTEPVISPVRVNAECDPEIAKVAFKALQKDRNERFRTALEFKDALEEAVGAKKARQADAKALMERLFGDVIEKQRAVLEQCLSAGEQATDGVDDDDHAPRRPSDSESDLSMKSLREKSEVTTPSVVRPSPLVTGEESKIDAIAHTSLERPRAKMSENTKTDEVIAPASNKSRAPLLAALAGALTVCLVGVVAVANHWIRSPLVPADDVALSSTLPVPPLTPVAAPAPSAPVPIAAIAHPPSTGITAPSPSSTAAGTTTAPSPSSSAPGPTVPSPSSASGATTAPSTPSSAAHTSAGRASTAPSTLSGDGSAHATTAAVDAEEPRMAPDPKRAAHKKSGGVDVDKRAVDKPVEDAKVAEGGTLSLDTVPWTVVYLGKRKLGETPLVKVPVPSGALELVLVNTDENLREQYIANVKPGAEFRARLDLH